MSRPNRDGLKQDDRKAPSGRYAVLCRGLFDAAQVRVAAPSEEFDARFSAADRVLVDSLVAEAQRRAIVAGRRFFNARLFRLGAIELAGPEAGLALKLGTTCYFDYAATRSVHCNGVATQRADPLGTSIIVVTSDGFVPLGRRAPDLDVNPGRLFSFGGFFDPACDTGNDGLPDLFGCFLREFREETGLELPRDCVRLLGIIYDHQHPHPEAVALATPATISAEDIRHSAWREELADLQLIHVSQLREFVADNHGEITEGLLGGLESLLPETLFDCFYGLP